MIGTQSWEGWPERERTSESRSGLRDEFNKSTVTVLLDLGSDKVLDNRQKERGELGTRRADIYKCMHTYTPTLPKTRREASEKGMHIRMCVCIYAFSAAR